MFHVEQLHIHKNFKLICIIDILIYLLINI